MRSWNKPFTDVLQTTVQKVARAILTKTQNAASQCHASQNRIEALLDSAEAAVHVDNVLMDREFDSQHILGMVSHTGGYTKLKNFGLGFFYFVFACLLYSTWRAVDLLLQIGLSGEYEHSPIVTADNTLLKKETRIG